MSAYVLCDRPPIATHLRRILTALGRDCSLGNVFSLDQVKRLPLGSPGELVIVVAPDDNELTSSLIRQARTIFTGRIACVGCPQEPRAVLEALHAGADYYIDESADLESQVTEILLRMDAAGKPTKSAGQLIVVTSASGGVGCTTLCSNLAVATAQRCGKSILVDLATEHGESADHFNVKPRHTLGDVLRSVDSLDHDVVSQSLTSHSSGVSLLAGGLGPHDLAEASPGEIERILGLLRSSGEVCFVDAGQSTARRFRLAVIAERIVLVVRLDFPSLCNARRLLDEWNGGQVEMSKVTIVACRSGQPAEIPRSQAQTFLGQPLDVCIPDDPVSHNVSANCGIPLLLESPKTRAAQEIVTLANRLITPAEPAADAASPQDKPRRSLWKRLAAAAS